MKRLGRRRLSVRSRQAATEVGIGIESGRFLGQSGLRTQLGGKGPVAIDPKLSFTRHHCAPSSQIVEVFRLKLEGSRKNVIL
jgi:hypothetical protein